jgi:hypothetical protein
MTNPDRLIKRYIAHFVVYYEPKNIYLKDRLLTDDGKPGSDPAWEGLYGWSSLDEFEEWFAVSSFALYPSARLQGFTVIDTWPEEEPEMMVLPPDFSYDISEIKKLEPLYTDFSSFMN